MQEAVFAEGSGRIADEFAVVESGQLLEVVKDQPVLGSDRCDRRWQSHEDVIEQEVRGGVLLGYLQVEMAEHARVVPLELAHGDGGLLPCTPEGRFQVGSDIDGIGGVAGSGPLGIELDRTAGDGRGSGDLEEQDMVVGGEDIGVIEADLMIPSVGHVHAEAVLTARGDCGV